MQDRNQAYLKETYYCDYNNPIFQDVPIKPSKSTRDTAIDVFHFVRDNFPLSADTVKVSASETMKKGYGACWNKALLMVALLRKYSIPGRIVKHPLKKEFLKPLIGNDVLFLNNPYYHCFVQVLVDGNWVLADPSLDAVSYEKLYRPLHVKWNINWDGKTDHKIHVDKILGQVEIINDIDASFNSGLGNRSTPGFLIPVFNKKYWKKTGWHHKMIKNKEMG